MAGRRGVTWCGVVAAAALGLAGCLDSGAAGGIGQGDAGTPGPGGLDSGGGGVDAGDPDAGEPPVCPATCDDGDPCTEGACGAATGYLCAQTAAPDGTSCGPCGAVCAGGVCGGGVGELVPTCADDADCDDGDPCTADTCDEDLCVCERVPVPGCGDPVCPPDCDDANPCTIDHCDEEIGQCVHVPYSDGTPCGECAACAAGECIEQWDCVADVDCEDGDPCTADACSGCACVHEVIPGCGPTCADGCDDGNACTEDVCAADGACAHPPLVDGTTCNDTCGGVCVGGECTGWALPGGLVAFECGGDADCDDGEPCTLDTCNAWCLCETSWLSTPECSGLCAGVSCEDGDPCTDGACDEATGQCVQAPAPDGTACGACGAACFDGGCITPSDPPAGGCFSAWECDDGDPCSDDLCTDECLCEHVPLALPGCGDPCAGVVCDDGDPCTEDVCGAGQCSFVPAPPGTSCGECAVCQDTACVPLGMGCASDADCDDGDPCTIELCSECLCLATPNPACGCGADGASCDDADPCTADLCVDGVCFHTADPSCQATTCSSVGALPIAEALATTGAGGALKVAGSPGPGLMQMCTQMACGPEDPCCNSCGADLVIDDGTGQLVATAADEPWSCATDGCGVVESCQPPHHDSAYWLWGTLGPPGVADPGSSPRPPP